MLANLIALITLAVMLGSEASRARPPWNYGLWTLSTVVILVAIGLGPISSRLPAADALAGFITSVFGSPVAWFVLFVGLFMTLRPFWTRPKVEPIAVRDDRHIRALGQRAGRLSRDITQYRNTRYLWRDDLPPLAPIIHDCNSLLLSLVKAGFTVPEISSLEMERTAVGLEHYFRVLHPLIRDGHEDFARENAATLARTAESMALNLNPHEWWQAR